jgi:hypothetical protein
VEKGGLASELTRAGVTQETRLGFADEMRVGLMSQVRRVWAPRGVKVRQRIQMDRVWRYLALAVDPRRGRLVWHWIANMKGPSIAEAAQRWREQDIEAVVWDGASGHGSAEVKALGLTAIRQPSYAPELNPPERVFQELRREVEVGLYASIDGKVAAVERQLRTLAADPDRVMRLVGWSWILQAYERLPQMVAIS